MKGIKNWLERSIVTLCDTALKIQDCAEDQNEINEIIAIRNDMLRRIHPKATTCKDCGKPFVPHYSIPDQKICEDCCRYA